MIILTILIYNYANALAKNLIKYLGCTLFVSKIFTLGLTDNSGMRFFVTKNLRQYDAGIMELGLVYTDRMAIPPSQETFPLNGYCLPECTANVSKCYEYKSCVS